MTHLLSFTSLQTTYRQFPRQFWLLFFGMLISTVGTSMIWPFQTIYASKKLGLPLAEITLLLSVNAICGLLSSVLFGPVIDRMGRKWPMVLGLFAHAASLLTLSQADTYLSFALLMGLNGIVNPIYRIAADAMVGDLIPAQDRTQAVAMIRLSHNLGIAVGPAIGGVLAGISYTYIFIAGALGLSIYSTLILVRGKETIPAQAEHPPLSGIPSGEALGGYLHILKDSAFISFFVLFTLAMFCAVLIWQIMPVHAINLGVSEKQYGLIPATNALMVVTLQMLFTASSKRFAPLLVTAVGAALYALAVGSVALGSQFIHFWLSMVLMTTGELLLVPTASTYVLNLAPATMRGRYMGIYGLSWSLSAMMAPVLGGYLTDYVDARAPWLAAMGIGLLASLFMLLRWQRTRPHPAPVITPNTEVS